MNRIVLGPGILAGLNVLEVDDKTILIEPGAAIDYLGREIIVESPYTARLSTIDGFDSVSDYEDAYLNISYNEEHREAVHSISSKDENSQSSEHNRLLENYKLSLSNKMPNLQNSMYDLIAMKKFIIIASDSLDISLKFDHIANKEEGFNSYMDIDFKGEHKAVKLIMKFKSEFINHGKEIVFEFDESKVKHSLNYNLEYNFPVSDVKMKDDIIELTEFLLESEEKTIDTIDNPIKHTVKISDKNKVQQIIEKHKNLSLDDVLEYSYNDVICLAKIRILKTKKTYVIENVVKDPFDIMIYNLQLSKIISKFSPLQKNIDKLFDKSTSDKILSEEKVIETVSDISTVSDEYIFRFEDKVDARDKFFSEEISHSLGVGDVFIDIFFDSDTSDGESSFGYQNQLVSGDYEIFKRDNHESVLPIVKWGTILYKNKGSFILGIQFMENYSKDEFKVKWKATKINKKYESFNEKENVLTIEPSMLKVPIRSKVSFNVFLNDKPIKCIWKVKDENGGTIDQNGVYMSPSLEGVYEIVADIPDYNENISAYVIVEN